MVTLLGIDPGISHDPCGAVLTEYARVPDRSYVRDAYQFTGMESYEELAAAIMQYVRAMSPDWILMEDNGYVGHFTIRALSPLLSTYAGLFTPITTCGEMSDAGRMAKDSSMDKPYTIKWLRTEMRNRSWLYPRNPSNDLKVLETQVKDMTEYKQLTGHSTYRAQLGRHDDLFMGMLLTAHGVRILRQRNS